MAAFKRTEQYSEARFRLRARATGFQGCNFPPASLNFQQKRRPRFERRAAFYKIVVCVVHALNAGQFVIQTPRSGFGAHSECRRIDAHGASKIRNRKRPQAVLNGGKRRVEGIDAPM